MNQRETQFESIFLSTKENLYAYVKKFAGNDQDIEDVMQQCYIRLWLRMEELKDSTNILPLLYTYAKNLLIDTWRKQAVEKRNLQEYGYLLVNGRQVHPAPSDMQDVQEQMKRALLQMPERRRTIFLLRKEYGLSSVEIAVRLNISQQAVRRHLDEAVGLLKKHISAADLFMVLVNAGPVAFSLTDLLIA
jgi:RNA polymerase sigma factor (sigma-70 family)